MIGDADIVGGYDRIIEFVVCCCARRSKLEWTYCSSRQDILGIIVVYMESVVIIYVRSMLSSQLRKYLSLQLSKSHKFCEYPRVDFGRSRGDDANSGALSFEYFCETQAFAKNTL